MPDSFVITFSIHLAYPQYVFCKKKIEFPIKNNICSNHIAQLLFVGYSLKLKYHNRA